LFGEDEFTVFEISSLEMSPYDFVESDEDDVYHAPQMQRREQKRDRKRDGGRKGEEEDVPSMTL
jgi:hypothetical protein